MTPTDKILNFLADHPAIAVKRMEKDLGLPQSTIGQALNGSRDIPPKHIDNILAYLTNYGMKK